MYEGELKVLLLILEFTTNLILTFSAEFIYASKNHFHAIYFVFVIFVTISFPLVQALVTQPEF